MNLRKYYVLLVLPFLLTACSSVVFPDIVDEDKSLTRPAASEPKKVIEEGKSLPSDEANAAYEGSDKTAENKNVPVFKGNPEETKSSKLFADNTEVKKEEGVSGLYVANKDNVIVTDDKYVESEENNKVEEPKQPGPADEDFVASITFRAATIYFENGQYGIPSEHAKEIKAIAKQAKEKNARVYVYGFSSSRTKNMDIASHKLANFNVSLSRANSVAKELKRAGLSANVIFVEAMSDTIPAYLEVMPEGERLNRRAEIFLSY